MNTGDKVTFDVSGTLSGSTVTIGCQVVNLADLIASRADGGEVRVTGDNVTAKVTGKVVAAGEVEFANGRRFTTGQVREVARNLTTEAAAPARVWHDGSVVVTTGTGDTPPGLVRVRTEGRWLKAESGRSLTRTDLSHRSFATADERVTAHVAEGQYRVLWPEQGPDTLRWQDGDRLRIGDRKVGYWDIGGKGRTRTRVGGRWQAENGRGTGGDGDVDYNVGQGNYVILRKGGVDFT